MKLIVRQPSFKEKKATWINIIERNDVIARIINTPKSTQIKDPIIHNRLHKRTVWECIPLTSLVPGKLLGTDPTNAHGWYWDNPEQFIKIINNTNADIALSKLTLTRQTLNQAQQKQLEALKTQKTQSSMSQLPTRSMQVVYITRNYDPIIDAQDLLKVSKQIESLHKSLVGHQVFGSYQIAGKPIVLTQLNGDDTPVYDKERYSRITQNIDFTNQVYNKVNTNNHVGVLVDIFAPFLNPGTSYTSGRARKLTHQLFYNQLWLLENDEKKLQEAFSKKIDARLTEVGLGQDGAKYIIIAHITPAYECLTC